MRVTSPSRTFTATLLLGDRSPYGLSVARALLDAANPRQIVRITAVVCPTTEAWARISERAARARPIASYCSSS